MAKVECFSTFKEGRFRRANFGNVILIIQQLTQEVHSVGQFWSFLRPTLLPNIQISLRGQKLDEKKGKGWGSLFSNLIRDIPFEFNFLNSIHGDLFGDHVKNAIRYGPF